MTTLETKIFDFIESQYEAKFLGKVKIDIGMKNKTIIQNIPTEITTTTKKIIHGRLYNWYALTDPRGIAPVGWHVPTLEDSAILSNFVNGVGAKLKSTGTEYWLEPNVGATDEFGFNGIPSGIRDPNGVFAGIKEILHLLGASEESEDYAYLFLGLHYNNTYFTIDREHKTWGWPTRFVKDDSIYEGDIEIDGDIYNTIKIGNQVWLQQNVAVKHYQNGDLIGNDFMIPNTGAVAAYNNDENNVYKTTTITEIVQIPTPVIVSVPDEYCLLITLSNYMIPLPICIQTDNEDDFYKYACKELSTRNFPIVKYFKLIKNDTNDDKNIVYK